MIVAKFIKILPLYWLVVGVLMAIQTVASQLVIKFLTKS